MRTKAPVSSKDILELKRFAESALSAYADQSKHCSAKKALWIQP